MHGTYENLEIHRVFAMKLYYEYAIFLFYHEIAMNFVQFYYI